MNDPVVLDVTRHVCVGGDSQDDLVSGGLWTKLMGSEDRTRPETQRVSRVCWPFLNPVAELKRESGE